MIRISAHLGASAEYDAVFGQYRLFGHEVVMYYKIVNKKKLYATKMADAVGKLLYMPLNLFKRQGEITAEAIHSILLIRTAYIGDVMMAVPMLRPLRRRFPNAHIAFLTSSPASELLHNNPDLDEIITYNPFWFYPDSPKSDYFRLLKTIGKKRFDLVIESRGDIREILLLVRPLNARYKVSYGVGGGAYMLTHEVPYPGLKHKVEYHLDICRYLGCPVDGLEWGVHLSSEEKRRVEHILQESGIAGPFVAVHPGSRLSLKRWPDDRYAALCDRIAAQPDLTLVLLGAPAETPQVEGIVSRMKQTPVNLSGKLDLRHMAGVIQHARIFVCNDSAPMHLAAAVGTPTVALFGPSKSVETSPYGHIHRVVESNIPCRFTCDESTCLHSQPHDCMLSITVDQVFSAFLELLGT